MKVATKAETKRAMGNRVLSIANARANLSGWEGFFDFTPTQPFHWLLTCPCQIIVFFTGNQFGKNKTVVQDYALRLLGRHPNPQKNVSPTDEIRVFRFASQTLPGEKVEGEVANTQYPVLKKTLPSHMIGSDITERKPVLAVNTACGPYQFEFVSYGQVVQRTAGQQRKGIWIDEACGQEFFEEQYPARLIASDGDLIITYTPTPGTSGWEFDYLYERARIVYRTQYVRDRIKERTGKDIPEIEKRETGHDIGVIIAATDDNPIYARLALKKSQLLGRVVTAKQYIDSKYDAIADENIIDARRYGLHRQLSGKIYANFVELVHCPPNWSYLFPNGVPDDWKHFRGCDYHPVNEWAVIFLSRSPRNEIFIWDEADPSPTRKTTDIIAKDMALMSGDYKFLLDLIDPLSHSVKRNLEDKKKINEANVTTLDDLNKHFRQLRREGIGTGAHWQCWDTQGTRGREDLSYRFKNSLKCERPFNNEDKDLNGNKIYLPTVWISPKCRKLIEGLLRWRLEEHKSRNAEADKDAKEKPIQRFSHFPITVECLLKNPLVSRMILVKTEEEQLRRSKTYYQGRI